MVVYTPFGSHYRLDSYLYITVKLQPKHIKFIKVFTPIIIFVFIYLQVWLPLYILGKL